MSAWARPGVKCVCIATAPEDSRLPGAIYPVAGQTYTVRKVVVVTLGPGKGDPSLLVEEIVNSPELNGAILPGVDSDLEPAFPIGAFRPLVSRTEQQDVALFRHHLADAPEPVA